LEYASSEIELFVSFLIILQKLAEISRLKQQRAAGRQLELNQLEKIKKEDELLRELQGLVL
jgi:translation initiation factor 2A